MIAIFIKLFHMVLLQDKYKEYSRDPQRTPMQWSGEVNAGFSTGNTTWLPVAPDYEERNVKVGEMVLY